MSETPMTVTREAVEAFLFHEADLMDEHRLEEWLALWAPQACYWIPCNGRTGGDPTREVSLVYDDLARLQDRIYRLTSSAAHSQRPRSRMRRVVGNLRLEQKNGLVHVRSNFLLAELRRGKQDLFSGVSLHQLRPQGDGFRIVAKTIQLDQSDEALDNLAFIL